MQVSAQTLPQKYLKKIFDNFLTVLSDLRSLQETQPFFNDFFTETEKLVLAKRLMIAKLLKMGKSYEEIKKELSVSSATISSVAEIIQKPGVQLALQKMHEDEWAETALHKVRKIFQNK
jgi:TrpR-related protein YerC/YecD